MDFTSLTFLFLFFPIFLSVYLISRPTIRLLLISIANIAFILAGQYAALLPLTAIALIGYGVGRAIEVNREKKQTVAFLMWLGIGINLAILAVFKLSGAYEIDLWLTRPFQLKDAVSLLGLSYITFQIISYLVDVSRRTISAETDVIKYLAYVLFFPKLVSGPITRYKQFRDQISTLDPGMIDTANGLRRVLIGIVKRILIANQLGVVANAAFGVPIAGLAPYMAWLGLVAYTLQIYFDFSGYTDVALGLGRLIGIDLPENFNYPYIAQGISDFWRRWHITLSTWFREYVFYPLERRRFRFAGQQINLVIVFLLTGLWHGPTLTFLIWGLIHGLAIAFESAGGARWLKTLWQPFRHLYAMFVIMLGWIFFRSPDLSFALGFISRLLGNHTGLTTLPFSRTTPFPFIEPSFVIVVVIALVFSVPVTSIWKQIRQSLETSSRRYYFVFQATEDSLLVALFILSVAAHVAGAFAPNIYAKF